MIYSVYVDDKLLYYPDDEKYVITNAVLNQSLNEAGSFEFDIPSNHTLYDDFNVRRSMIKVLKDDDEIFFGEVREIKQNFDFTRHIYAVGELAFLFDSIQPQHKYQTTPTNMFSSLIANHNSQVEDRKKFTLGSCLVTDPNDYIYRFTNYEDTLTAIREKMCKTLDGYLRIRKVGSTRYLDIIPLENYGSYCEQVIEFSKNLLDYSANTQASDIATAVIPLGATLEERTADAVDGLDEKLTIKSVNNGVDYVYIQSAVDNFGWVKVVKEWSDVNTAANLKIHAENWLQSAQYAQMTLELNAFDLNNLDSSIDSFEVGDTVRAKAEPFGMNTIFPIQKKTTYLNDLNKNYIVLGNSVSLSFTKQSSDAVNTIKEELPQTFTMLDEAKKSAVDLLTGVDGGYVTFVTNEAKTSIEKIIITNAPEESNSTRKWEWSSGGLGHFTRSSIGQAWSNINLALTMDGAIVADRITTGSMSANRITTGSMSADRIFGGTLTLGGQNNVDGVMKIKDSNNADVGLIDKAGVKLDYTDTQYNYNRSVRLQLGDTVKRTNNAGLYFYTNDTESASITNEIKVNGSAVTDTLKINSSNKKILLRSPNGVSIRDTEDGGMVDVKDGYVYLDGRIKTYEQNNIHKEYTAVKSAAIIDVNGTYKFRNGLLVEVVDA